MFKLFKRKKPVILFGGTGQAKLMRPVLEDSGYRIIAVFDKRTIPSPFKNVPLYHQDEFSKYYYEHIRYSYGPRIPGLSYESMNRYSNTHFCLTMGNPHSQARLDLHHSFVYHYGLQPVNAIHKTAYIAKNAEIGPGIQISAGANIMEKVKIEKQCIINTNATIEHECQLAAGVEIAPGATLCGNVKVGMHSWIGAGATILPDITIGHNTIIGAGAVVINDIEPHKTVVGVPAKKYL